MAYVTVKGPGRAEIVIKKSRFIAAVAHARSESDAWSFIEAVRAEHRTANHNVFAFKVGTAQRMSDDGEPSGTAGRPVFDVLDKQGLSDVVVVITRYFGGILLGAGGLVHAYSQAAVAGIEAAGIARAQLAVDLRFAIDYPMVGTVRYLLQKRGALTLDTQYGAGVIITCRLPIGLVDDLEAELAEISAGRIRPERLAEVQVGADLKPLYGSMP